MILKNETLPPFSSRLRPVWIWSGLGLIGLLVLGLVFQSLRHFGNGEGLYCGAEKTGEQNGVATFVHDGSHFTNGLSQSNEEARTGRYSSKVTEASPYGIGWQVENPEAGAFYELSVWRKGLNKATGILVGTLSGESGFYREAKAPVERTADGWERLELYFGIPENFEAGTLKIYAYANEFGPGGTVYFDDLRIYPTSMDARLKKASQTDTAFATLELLVPPAGMLKLESKAQEAQNEGILVTTADSWVKGKILQPNNKIPVSLRLKGDATDHLREGNWSFRLRTRLPETWQRLHTFSVQKPKTRYNLHEWIFHQLLVREGVLTTRYDFLHFRLNGDYKGVYAYEEHFEKILVESQQRREGPILKFDETGLWNARKRDQSNPSVPPIERDVHAYEGAKILPFQEDQIVNDTALHQQFLQAQTLLRQFQFEGKRSSEVFDAQQMGRYYALVDLTEAYHNLIWHNLRFYFNPVTVRLEPIGFDGYTEEGIAYFTHLPLIGSMADRERASFQDRMHPKVFADPELTRHYVASLLTYSHPRYWELFLKENEQAIKNREALIQLEHPSYGYDTDLIRQRARQIRSLIMPVAGSAVKAYNNGEKAQALQVQNFHLLPLAVVGMGKKADRMSDSLPQPVLLGPYDRGTTPQFTQVESNVSDPQYLFYRLPGLDSLFSCRILPWPVSAAATPPQELFAGLKIENNDWYEVQGRDIRFRPGPLSAAEDILIPRGYQVYFPAGTKLNLEKGAAFISYSPVRMMGTEAEPVLIHSGDQSGNGFTVIQAEERSQLRYVQFEHLNTLSREGWNLTGAVTFYESDLDIVHCAFVKNHCEDALNLIRSDFLLEHSLISQTAFDGFDADFCRGTIRNTRFYQTGNDGMDFSGSIITVQSAEVEQAGDKGLSVGEAAEITVNQLIINRANLGVASKDLSRLNINRISLSNCTIGFAAYQKKPEYGPASISVDNYEVEKVKRLHQIERGSTLILAGSAVSPI